MLRTLIPLVCGALLLPACASSPGAEAEHAAAMAREHAHETPAASEAALEPAQDVVAREVTYGTAGGRPLTGYLAEPMMPRGAAERRAPLPGVVMIHEWWGLNDNVRTMARRLAGEGYTVLAVDMYGGQTAQTPEQARSLMMGVMQSPAAGEANLGEAAEYLAEEHDAPRVGIMGWCFGGGWALRGALAVPERIDAAVMYYGQPITEAARLARLDAPLLGLFGAEDEGIPVAQVRQMEARLRELNKEATIVVYPGAGHAFANPSGQSYKAEPAGDAWRRTTEFFARHLKRDAR